MVSKVYGYCTLGVVPYSRNISLRGENFRQAQYLCIAVIFRGINFCHYSKGWHIHNVIFNTGRKFADTKLISPMRADGGIGENFLLAKISGYTGIMVFLIEGAA